jgi:hypothetical protein
MPGLGLTPARGNWESRWFETTSTATFAKGSLVNLTNAYRLKEYTSTDSQVLGIAASHSTASTILRGLPMIQVYLPTPNCTALSDLTTGVVQSDLSIGKHILIYKQGNLMSYASTVKGLDASAFSTSVAIVGPIDADMSRVEVAFNLSNVAIYSGSSITITA